MARIDVRSRCRNFLHTQLAEFRLNHSHDVYDFINRPNEMALKRDVKTSYYKELDDEGQKFTLHERSGQRVQDLILNRKIHVPVLTVGKPSAQVQEQRGGCNSPIHFFPLQSDELDSVPGFQSIQLPFLCKCSRPFIPGGDFSDRGKQARGSFVLIPNLSACLVPGGDFVSVARRFSAT